MAKTENAKKMIEIFDQINEADSFGKFLRLVRFSLSRNEERYAEEVKKTKYLEDYIEMLSYLFADDENDTDILGDFYENRITFGENGQFFTPEHICDMMVEMTIENNLAEKNIIDPACGSGRFLLSCARKHPSNTFWGVDLDERCATIAAINLALHGISGYVIWGNTLTNEVWRIYNTGMHNLYSGMGLMRETEDPEELEKMKDILIRKNVKKNIQKPTKTEWENKLTLF